MERLLTIRMSWWELLLSCVSFPQSDKVTDSRGGCYGDSSLSKRRGYVTKRTTSYEEFAVIPTHTSGTRQKRKCFHMQPCKHTEHFWAFKVYCPRIINSGRRNWILEADQGSSRYNIPFFGFNTNRSAKRIILDLIMINGPLLVSGFLKQRLLLSSLQGS